MKILALLLAALSVAFAFSPVATINTNMTEPAVLIPNGEQVILASNFSTQLYAVENNTFRLVSQADYPLEQFLGLVTDQFRSTMGLMDSGAANTGVWTRAVDSTDAPTVDGDILPTLAGVADVFAYYTINNTNFVLTQVFNQDTALYELAMFSGTNITLVFPLEQQVIDLAPYIAENNASVARALGICATTYNETIFLECTFLAPQSDDLPEQFKPAHAAPICITHPMNVTLMAPVTTPVNATHFEIYDGTDLHVLDATAWTLSQGPAANQTFTNLVTVSNIPASARGPVYGLYTQDNALVLAVDMAVAQTPPPEGGNGNNTASAFHFHSAECVPSPWNLCR